MSLPKWLQGTKKPVIVHQRESARMLDKTPVKIEGRPEDTTLFVGASRGQILMQEVLDREGIGRQRCFDAGAMGGRGSAQISQAEHRAATIVSSIDK